MSRSKWRRAGQVGVVLALVLPVIGHIGQVAAQSTAGDREALLSQRICSNLASETQRVLNDAGDTHKYLSPYIAVDLYQQVAADSLTSMVGSDTEGLVLPEMSALPCQDTVSDFMMAIKKRMEYGRFDRMVAGNRVWLTGAAILLLTCLIGWVAVRRLRQREPSLKD